MVFLFLRRWVALNDIYLETEVFYSYLASTAGRWPSISRGARVVGACFIQSKKAYNMSLTWIIWDSKQARFL